FAAYRQNSEQRLLGAIQRLKCLAANLIQNIATLKEVGAMQLPLQISFHHVPRSDEVEDTIRQHAERLDEFFGRITSCRVVVDQPHQHHHEGNLYQVRIDITVPGEEIVVNRHPGEHTAHRDLETVIGEHSIMQ